MLAILLCAGVALGVIIGSATSTSALTGGRVLLESLAYSHNGTALAGFVVRGVNWNNGSAPRPAVVIVPDWTGLDDYEQRRGRLIAEQWGFVAVGADIYGGGLSLSDASAEAAAMAPFVSNGAFFAARVNAAVAAARALSYVDAKRIAVFGFGFGGSGAIDFASAGLAASAVVAFHPGAQTLAPSGAVNAPLLVLAGTADVPDATFEAQLALFANRTDRFELQRFGRAKAQFSVWGAPTYSADADARAWASAGAWTSAWFNNGSFAADAAAARCGGVSGAAIVADPTGCCDLCWAPTTCANAVCAPLQCAAGSAPYTQRGSCCPVCMPVCVANATCAPLACNVLNSHKYVVDGQCCAQCVATCSEYRCPIASATPAIDGVAPFVPTAQYVAVSYNASDGTPLVGRLYYAEAWRKDDARRALVVVVHDYNGITSAERARAQMLVEQGYYAFLADVYGAAEQAKNGAATWQYWLALFSGWLGQPEALAARVVAGVAAARAFAPAQIDAARVALFGYCFGGSAVLDAALLADSGKSLAALNVRAVLAFHPGLPYIAYNTSALASRVAIYTGALDNAPPSAVVVTTESELANVTAKSLAEFELTRYGGAYHAFTVFDQQTTALPLGNGESITVGYQARADSRSWPSALDFVARAFNATSGGSPQPDAFVALGAPLPAFASVNDVVTYAQRWAVEDVYMRAPSLIGDVERALLVACRATVDQFRACYVAVSKAMEDARRGNGVHAGKLRFDSDSESDNNGDQGHNNGDQGHHRRHHK